MPRPEQAPAFLRVANWERFQNADVFRKSKGRPPWIKTYVAQLEHFAYGQLTPSERGWLHDLRLLAATVENKIPNDPAWLRTRLGIPAGVRRMPPLARLTELGFLEPWQPVLVTNRSRSRHDLVTNKNESGTYLVTENESDSPQPSGNTADGFANDSRTLLPLEVEEEREGLSLQAVANGRDEASEEMRQANLARLKAMSEGVFDDIEEAA